MSRPICVHCGAAYGQRDVRYETVRWDAPIKPSGFRAPATFTREGLVPGEPTYSLDGEPPPPPPYRGNGIVVKESDPYLGADSNRMVMTRSVWDGETWSGGAKPFCTLRCALDYARKAYARSVERQRGEPLPVKLKVAP